MKRGKHTAVKGKGQKRFIRFQTLGTGYSEEEIKAVLEGKAKHQPYQRTLPKEQPFQLLVDIQGKMAEGKSVGYKKWATKFNLKEMSKTLLFLQEQKISSADELRERATAATERYHAMAIPSRRRKRGWPKSPCRASQVGILRLSGKRFEPSIRKKRKIFIPTWVYSCCVRHEENRSESCRIVFPHMDVSRMGYGHCNILYGQIRQKSLIFFIYL